MKTAEEWDKEGVAYASAARKIQADALRHAANKAMRYPEAYQLRNDLRAEADKLDQK